MAYQFIITETDTGVMRITLNRPEVLNSFTLGMSHELRDALAAAQAEPGVRAVLITGAGKGFCAGQDLNDVPPAKEGKPDLGALVKQRYNPLIMAIRELDKPVVCAVNGVAAGAGANFALACDIIIAADTASFIQSFSRIGLIPDSGGTFFLPRAIGLQMATALMMTGEKISAERAAELGMVYRVVPADSLATEAIQLAKQLAGMPTKAFAYTKRALNASMGNNLEQQLQVEEDMQRQAGHTQDFAEGVAAFTAKRKPVFTGE